MKLTAEQIQDNWYEFNENIKKYISEPRRTQLLDFYKKYEERIMLMPASHKKEYHSAFPGGYILHVNKVVKGALAINKVWEDMEVDKSTYTLEELIFSAINHDLGKLGDDKHESYIPQTDNWRREKLGEDYTFNDRLEFASVPDRGLFLLQDNGIKYSFNEMIAIQTHDGLYDDGNKKYLMGWMPGQKPRTSLPFILHQADLMAARIEFEQEWLHQFTDEGKAKENFKLEKIKKDNKLDKTSKALRSVKGSEGLASLIDKL